MQKYNLDTPTLPAVSGCVPKGSDKALYFSIVS